MKVLHLFPYLPVPKNFGGALRIYHILKHHVDRHEVTVCGFDDRGDKVSFFEEFPQLKDRSHFISRPFKKKFRRLVQLYSLFTNHSDFYTMSRSKQLQETIDRLLDANDFDLVLAEFPSAGSFQLNTDAVKILDAHNVEYENFKRMSNIEGSILRKFFYDREYRKFKKEELAICGRKDAMFVTSERDREIFDQDLPHVPKFVVPNGVDTGFFHPSDQKPEPFDLVFTGMMGYVPNYDGIHYFLDEIFPIVLDKIPEARIFVVGMNPPKSIQERATDNVIVTGFVDDVRPYVHRSSVYVVPLRMGSGTRLKVLEALSMKKPVVTTSIGCEGIDVIDGQTALIRDDAQDFAEAVVTLIKNQPLRQKLIDNGYQLIKEKYDWQVIGDHIERAYEQILNKETIPQLNAIGI